ncbi:uncharacterized protein L201_007456 [Kwoniella dendrophila CBS 6074]|uniref:Uncharacterized protein n=1 Tax=Kwoniella dendrophila CBS 6074 TaxID=1295534 RepID=A0AAX4K4K8_9TREE
MLAVPCKYCPVLLAFGFLHVALGAAVVNSSGKALARRDDEAKSQLWSDPDGPSLNDINDNMSLDLNGGDETVKTALGVLVKLDPDAVKQIVTASDDKATFTIQTGDDEKKSRIDKQYSFEEITELNDQYNTVPNQNILGTNWWWQGLIYAMAEVTAKEKDIDLDEMLSGSEGISVDDALFMLTGRKAIDSDYLFDYEWYKLLKKAKSTPVIYHDKHDSTYNIVMSIEGENKETATVKSKRLQNSAWTEITAALQDVMMNCDHVFYLEDEGAVP